MQHTQSHTLADKHAHARAIFTTETGNINLLLVVQPVQQTGSLHTPQELKCLLLT